MIYTVSSANGFLEMAIAICGMIPKSPFAIRIAIKTYRKAVKDELAAGHVRITDTGANAGEKFIAAYYRSKKASAKWEALDPSLTAHKNVTLTGRARPKDDADRQRRYKRYMTNWHFLTVGAAVDRIMLINDLQRYKLDQEDPQYKLTDSVWPFVDESKRVIPFTPNEDFRIPYSCFFSTIFLKTTGERKLRDALKFTRAIGIYLSEGNFYTVYFLVSPLWEEYNTKGTVSVMPDAIRDELVSIARDKTKEAKAKGQK
jgi:hypothetical protein